jgi:isoamylase
VHGPYDPEHGHRFNPNKLLIDPYAKQLFGRMQWDDALFAYQVGNGEEDLSFDERDSAAFIPKCRVVKPFRMKRSLSPRTAFSETIIYEAHVKGLTQLHPGVTPKWRGKLAALTTPAVVEHLARLGITAIELMPVHSFIDDRFLIEKGLRNYWGYNTIGFFAPDPRYLLTDKLREFRDVVRALHGAGIEVILDVVYNHTAEGNQMGPTLSFRGIDNASYYRLVPKDKRHYWDATGCGNTLNMTHPRVLQMVMDSLRYWVTDMGVDGFRFDLAAALGREHPNYDIQGGFFRAVRQDPVLSRVKMIAEPWDVSGDGYQVGHFPPGWSEWNGKFRDTMRSYWKGDEGMLADFASRLTGSTDLYNHHGRRPWASINFIRAHDGFTLADLVSYNEPHNEANQEESGHKDNKSWNCGAEGPTDDEAINELRARQQRNFIATLMLAQGVPMLLAGDEIGNSQQGNNNAYCQDSEISWIHWELDEAKESLLRFAHKVITLRKKYHALRRRHFFRQEEEAEAEIQWLAPSGEKMTEEDWHNGKAHALMLKLAVYENQPELLLLFNAWAEDVPCHLLDRSWKKLLDTSDPDGGEDMVEGEYALPSRSILVLEAA